MKYLKLFLTALMALSIVALYSCGNSNSGDGSGAAKDNARASAGSASDNSSSAGKFAFMVPDVEGNAHNFNDFIGKPLIVNFWGTWCPPCRRELPDLKKIYAEYKPQGLEIIGLAVNDTPAKVKSFARKENLDWIMLMATQDAALTLGYGKGVPTTIFYDRDGNEVARAIGMRNYDYFKEQVEKII